jgi:4-alpha-glucanotransferase
VNNAIVYTGTHDNNTTRGWFDNDLSRTDRKRLSDYLGRRAVAKDISWELIRLAMASVAKLAIIPLQDILGLGASARMNHPARIRGNWHWRLRAGKLSNPLADRLRRLAETHGRA